MSLLKIIKAQLGISSAPTNNFTLDASAQDGTMKLSRGNAGATTQDLMTVAGDGRVAFPAGLSAFLGDNQSLTTTGYQKLPGGLIIQWGQGSYANGSTVSFPTAFPNACFTVVACPDGLSAGNDVEVVAIASLSKTGFVAYGVRQAISGGAWSGFTGAHYWIAVGY